MSSSITPDSVGTFEVRTAAGTDFILELGAETGHVTRKPGMTHPEGGHEEPRRLPGDFTRLPLAEKPTVTEGVNAVLKVIVDDLTDRRVTTPVTGIRAL